MTMTGERRCTSRRVAVRVYRTLHERNVTTQLGFECQRQADTRPLIDQQRTQILHREQLLGLHRVVELLLIVGTKERRQELGR